jgi:putative CRISPR-associated protein (TIGR02619 family)
VARNILVSVGISLVHENVQLRERVRQRSHNDLPREIGGLGRLGDKLKDADWECVTYDMKFDPEEGLWGGARDALVGLFQFAWTDTSLQPHERRLCLGAELASLERLGRDSTARFEPLGSRDRVVLLASDTAPGLFCAHVIHAALRAGVAGLTAGNVEVHPVEGLRPDDSECFLALGLPNAAQAVFNFTQPGCQTLLVGTGGYKGLLPYLAPVAMYLGIPLLYLYEESEDLMAIEFFRVQLDLDVIKRNALAFNPIGPITGLTRRLTRPAKEFWADVRSRQPADEQLIHAMHLVEEFDEGGQKLLRLSPAGALAWSLAYEGCMPTALEERGSSWFGVRE